jgi:hypothetical protein
MNDQDIRKFAHDIRAQIHGAKLNLDAADVFIAKMRNKDSKPLEKILQNIRAELVELEQNVIGFSSKFK